MSAQSATNLYDKAGSIYTPDRATLGDRPMGGQAYKFDRGIPTKVTLFFDRVPESAEIKSLILAYRTSAPSGTKSQKDAHYTLPFNGIQ